MNPFQTLSLGFILKKILKFCKFRLDILIKKKKSIHKGFWIWKGHKCIALHDFTLASAY